MTEFHAQAADDFRPLDQSEIEGVSGGALRVDMGILGILDVRDNCVSWELYSQDGNGGVSWTSVGQCGPC